MSKVRVKELEIQLAVVQRDLEACKGELLAAATANAELAESFRSFEGTSTETITELRKYQEKLQKDLDSANNMQKYYQNLSETAKKELEAAHTMLDDLPGALPRKDDSAEYGKQDKPLAARILHYIVTKMK